MNRTILLGRLTRDPEQKATQNDTAYCQFTIAVDRRFKNANGERQADFINCTAWKQNADFISKYFTKGSSIAVVGSIQTSSWDDKDGKKQFKTEVVVDEAYFAGGKGQEQGNVNQQMKQSASRPSYQGVLEDTLLPFDV